MCRLRRAALLLLLLFFAAGLLRFPMPCAQAARQGLALCFETVLPSLFPFFVLSSLVVSCGMAQGLARVLEPCMYPLFGLSGAGAGALVMGLIGGYPVGARTAAELFQSGALSRGEAERLLAFCNNAGPGFLLGVCGTVVFANMRAGLFLYLVHVLAAVLTGALLRRRLPRKALVRHSPPPAQRFSTAFPAAVSGAFASVWNVCAFVVLFMVLLRLITLILPDGAAQSPWYPLLQGAVELTNGVLALSADRRSFVLCAVLLGWGGLSVHAQTVSVLSASGLSLRRYWYGKLLHALLSAPLAVLVSGRLFPA